MKRDRKGYLKKGIQFSESNIFFQDSKTRIMSIGFFNHVTNSASRVSIQEFNNRDLTQMISRIDVPKLIYDTTAKYWIALNGVKRWFNDEVQKAEYFDSLKIDYLNFTLFDLKKKKRNKATNGYLINLSFTVNNRLPFFQRNFSCLSK